MKTNDDLKIVNTEKKQFENFRKKHTKNDSKI